MVELKVNPGELAAGGRGLEEAANGIPEPLAPFTSTGTDALSTILSTLTQEKEAPLIAGLPATKAEALTTARNIIAAAGMYERSDQQIATDVRNASSRVDSAGGVSSVGGAGAASSAGGVGQLQQLMSTPMQMAQQAGQAAGQMAQSAGQLPQGVMQGIQQIGSLAGGAGQSADSPEIPSEQSTGEEKPAAEARDEGAAAGPNDLERAPAAPSGATSPRHSRPDPGIVV